MALSSSGSSKFSYMLNLDTSSAGWIPVGEMTRARGYHTCGIVDNNKIVIVGGEDGSTAHDTVEIFNIATGKWSAGKG